MSAHIPEDPQDPYTVRHNMFCERITSGAEIPGDHYAGDPDFDCGAERDPDPGDVDYTPHPVGMEGETFYGDCGW